MADLAVSNVEILRTHSRTLSNGRIMFEKVCRFTSPAGTGAGGTANKLLASAFGLQTVEECSAGGEDGDVSNFMLAPAADNSYIVYRNPANGVPIDLGIGLMVYVTVSGY